LHIDRRFARASQHPEALAQHWRPAFACRPRHTGAPTGERDRISRLQERWMDRDSYLKIANSRSEDRACFTNLQRKRLVHLAAPIRVLTVSRASSLIEQCLELAIASTMARTRVVRLLSHVLEFPCTLSNDANAPDASSADGAHGWRGGFDISAIPAHTQTLWIFQHAGAHLAISHARTTLDARALQRHGGESGRQSFLYGYTPRRACSVLRRGAQWQPVHNDSQPRITLWSNPRKQRSRNPLQES